MFFFNERQRKRLIANERYRLRQLDGLKFGVCCCWWWFRLLSISKNGNTKIALRVSLSTIIKRLLGEMSLRLRRRTLFFSIDSKNRNL